MRSHPSRKGARGKEGRASSGVIPGGGMVGLMQRQLAPAVEEGKEERGSYSVVCSITSGRRG